jgi:hypothetical protein
MKSSWAISAAVSRTPARGAEAPQRLDRAVPAGDGLAAVEGADGPLQGLDGFGPVVGRPAEHVEGPAEEHVVAGAFEQRHGRPGRLDRPFDVARLQRQLGPAEAGDGPVEVTVDLFGQAVERFDGLLGLGRVARRQRHFHQVEKDGRGEGGGSHGHHPVGRPGQLLPGGVELPVGPGQEGGGVTEDVGGHIPIRVAVHPPGRGDVAARLVDLADLHRGQGGDRHAHAPAAAAGAERLGQGLLGAAQRPGEVAGQPADVALELQHVAFPPGGVGFLGFGEAAQRFFETAFDPERPAERHHVPRDPVGAAVGPGVGDAAPEHGLRLDEAALVEQDGAEHSDGPGGRRPLPGLLGRGGHLPAPGLQGR